MLSPNPSPTPIGSAVQRALGADPSCIPPRGRSKRDVRRSVASPCQAAALSMITPSREGRGRSRRRAGVAWTTEEGEADPAHGCRPELLARQHTDDSSEACERNPDLGNGLERAFRVHAGPATGRTWRSAAVRAARVGAKSRHGKHTTSGRAETPRQAAGSSGKRVLCFWISERRRELRGPGRSDRIWRTLGRPR